MVIKRFKSNFKTRYNFGKYQRYFQVPNLIEIQKKSYSIFLQEYTMPKFRKRVGLQSVFLSVFPIKNYIETSSLSFIDYAITKPKYSASECKTKGMIYSSSLQVKMKLILSPPRKKQKKLPLSSCSGGDLPPQTPAFFSM